ncbi:MAG: adenylate/guanylate cyclase domain-containing protein [Actinomycetota bacterium]
MDEERTDASNVVAFPVGRSGTRARRRPGTPASEPVQAPLGPERRVSVVEVEIRGAERLGSRVPPERARRAVETAVDRAAAALLARGAEDLRVEGTSTAPVLLATFAQTDHARRAVATAVEIRDLVRASDPADAPVQAGHGHGREREGLDAATGVHTGSVVDLAVGGVSPVPFRAVGILHALSSRLAADAGPGQILLSADALGHVTQDASVHAEGTIELNIHGERRETFCLLGFAASE